MRLWVWSGGGKESRRNVISLLRYFDISNAGSHPYKETKWWMSRGKNVKAKNSLLYLNSESIQAP